MPILRKMADTPAPTLDNDLLLNTYTEEEKTEILGEIESAAFSAHMQAAGAVEAFHPRKRGILFPILINAAAVVLVVVGWFGAQAYFTNRQDTLKIKTSQLFGTEGTLLAKVLEDSKAQLEAKNAEIGSIQANLDKMAQEKNSLVANFDSQLSAKENALKADLAKQLEAEKTRLQALGISQTDITAKLNEFQAQKNAEFNAQLDTYKKTAQAEIDQRTKEVAVMQAKLTSTQAETDKLKADYESKSAAREKDLQGQLSSQGASLDKLTREREELNLFFRQTDAQYANVRNALESGDLAKAQTAVGLLKGVLNTGAASPTDAVRQRSQADLLLANALDKTVNQLAEAAKKPDADPRFEAFKTAVKKAQAASADERPALMAKALASLPETEAALAVVQAWESQKALAALNDRLKAAEAQRGTDLAQKAAEQALLNQNWADAVDQREEDLATLRARVAALQSSLAAVQSNLDAEDSTLGATVAGLRDQLAIQKAKLDSLTAENARWTALVNAYLRTRDQALASLTDPTHPDFAAAKTLFLRPFATDDGKLWFPDYVATFDKLAAALTPPPTADNTAVRKQAFADVLLFTDYMQGKAGTAGSPKEAQTASEKLSRADDAYKTVVDAIQGLLTTGAKETILRTDKFRLFGSVLSRSGTKITVEPLTAASATVGQPIEVRRSSSKGETVLARGNVTAVGAKKTEADLLPATAPRTEPAAGDTVYLILN